MKTLYLHIGHGKTGTSYLQSSLALSIERLADRNIVYPRMGSVERGAKGLISSGNGSVFVLLMSKPKKVDEIAANPASHLFSYEGLMGKLSQPEQHEALARFAER